MEILIGREFYQKVVPLIEKAKNSIYIIVFDWRWYVGGLGSYIQNFNQAIVRAARRGVKVKAVVNTERIAQILRDLGIESKKASTMNLVHCKVMIIDEEIAIVGSHNYTESALTTNYEVSVMIKGRENISRLIEFFNNLYESIS